MTELLVHALTIELEAVQSYKDLADQMNQCNNTEVSELFLKMADLEARHVETIRERAGDIELPELAPWEYRWPGFEPPENIDTDGIHYMMTPHQALTLALENETNAMAFFAGVAASTNDDSVRKLAEEFAEDERQHAAWMKKWLARFPVPDDDWDDDPDPPAAID